MSLAVRRTVLQEGNRNNRPPGDGYKVYIDVEAKLVEKQTVEGKTDLKSTVFYSTFPSGTPIAGTLGAGMFCPAFEEVLRQMHPNSRHGFFTTLSVNLPWRAASGIGGFIPPRHAVLYYVVHLVGYLHPTDRSLSSRPANDASFAIEYPVDQGIRAHNSMVGMFHEMARLHSEAEGVWPPQDYIILLTGGIFFYRYYQWLESAAPYSVTWEMEAAREATRLASGGAGAGSSNSGNSSNSSSRGAGSTGQSAERGAGSSSSGPGWTSLSCGVALMAASPMPPIATLFSKMGAMFAAREQLSQDKYSDPEHVVGLSFTQWLQFQEQYQEEDQEEAQEQAQAQA